MSSEDADAAAGAAAARQNALACQVVDVFPIFPFLLFSCQVDVLFFLFFFLRDRWMFLSIFLFDLFENFFAKLCYVCFGCFQASFCVVCFENWQLCLFRSGFICFCGEIF